MLTPGRIYQNTSLRIPGAFTDGSGNATDPDTVTFKLMSPSGVLTTLTYGPDEEIIRVSAGNYEAYVTAGQEAGRWFYRWGATEDESIDITIAGEGSFLVQYSPFYDDDAPGYA